MRISEYCRQFSVLWQQQNATCLTCCLIVSCSQITTIWRTNSSSSLSPSLLQSLDGQSRIYLSLTTTMIGLSLRPQTAWDHSDRLWPETNPTGVFLLSVFHQLEPNQQMKCCLLPAKRRRSCKFTWSLPVLSKSVMVSKIYKIPCIVRDVVGCIFSIEEQGTLVLPRQNNLEFPGFCFSVSGKPSSCYLKARPARFLSSCSPEEELLLRVWGIVSLTVANQTG